MGLKWTGDLGLGKEPGKKRNTRTIGIELQNMNVAIGVCDDHVELLAVREEVGGHDFDVLRGFAKGAHLVGFLLPKATSLSASQVCKLTL